ncbi:hypothetical protein NKR19_g5423 [Coniochaeta hoffmannii]|uniref:Uncharacterized protein n=1 Tax=Coniochaeta hoffmannii TaxID=91930 RepID=A0AA38RK14_9PEZI|nr:hypothetical protein NKR19_g5423 [Coniochaeta hoffmannii]
MFIRRTEHAEHWNDRLLHSRAIHIMDDCEPLMVYYNGRQVILQKPKTFDHLVAFVLDYFKIDTRDSHRLRAYVPTLNRAYSESEDVELHVSYYPALEEAIIRFCLE